MIPKEALVCPHCRKRLRQSTTVRVILGGLVFLFLYGMVQSSGNNTSAPVVVNSAKPRDSSVPSFTLSGQDQKSMSVLVAKNISLTQLKGLILGLRKARIENNFGSLIPATTPGGSLGNHAFVELRIFTDPAWATSEKLQRLNKVRIGEKAYPREFVKHVKAYYFYSAMTNEEEGSIGMADTSGFRSISYQKLF
jgi:hypothetical protein